MSELGERVFNEVNKWWLDAALQGDMKVRDDIIKKTIELMEDVVSNQFRDKVDERVEEIAMQRAKDINGVPVRTLVAKDILNTLIGRESVVASNEELAEAAVDLTDELMRALNKKQ